MSQVRELMIPSPRCVTADTTLRESAQYMRDDAIGDVLVEKDGLFCGIVTDRDIVVRAVAEGLDPDKTPVSKVCTEGPECVPADADVEFAVRLMRDKAVRRLPVIDAGKVVGIVSLGDLAMEREPDSVLADISAAAPDH